ncbi:MAG: RecQ family ATP-dependent DNA helicase [Dehalococcoidia bacterium]
MRSNSRSKHRSHLDEIASLTLGIDDLSEAQEEAIESILEGRDTLAIMPTGAGKSAIYQIAGHLLEGPTVVFSPLLALQRDQAGKLERTDTGSPALLNSTVSLTARVEALEAAARGEVEFLFLAPEQLANEDVAERLIETKPSLLVVDEAHCISSWGHDFRPDYLALGELVEQLGHPVVLALTATASTPVQEEITERLAMRNARIVTQNLDRPNIHLEVRRFDDARRKQNEQIEAVAAEQKPGIVYAATRANAETLAEALQEAGVNAVYYHAGLPSRPRNEVQTRFMEGDVDVVVATKAFGMGIDKSNVRFVFHSDVSDSLDSYAQEIGRAGRDGQPAKAVLFYLPADLGIQRFFAAGQLSDADISAVLRAFSTVSEGLSRAEIAEKSGLGPRKVLRVLNGLVDAGMLRRSKKGTYRPLRWRSPQAGLEAVESLQEQWQRVNESRVEMMRGYAEEDGCRRSLLLAYFGEKAGPCGNCDNCERGGEAVAEGAEAPADVTVRHSLWGLGRVLRQESDRAVIFFQTVGYKTLDLTVALERGLLSREPGAAGII